MPCYRYAFRVETPQAACWEAAADRFGRVHRWARSVEASHLAARGPAGTGGRRVCIPARGLAGMETVAGEGTAREPGGAFACKGVDPPALLRRVASTWRLGPGRAGARVRIGVEGVPHARWPTAPPVALAWRRRPRPLVGAASGDLRARLEAPTGQAGRAHAWRSVEA